MSRCTAENCDGKIKARGMCNKHWKRWRAGGDINTPNFREKTDEERFWEKVKKGSGDECWLWTGGTRGYGELKYGVAWSQGKKIGAHRLSWILKHGHIPGITNGAPTEICHKCDVPLCVNPNHLFIGNKQDNMLDKIAKGRCGNRNKTHCPHGHEYSEVNTYFKKDGARSCRTCHRISEAKRRAKKENTSWL